MKDKYKKFYMMFDKRFKNLILCSNLNCDGGVDLNGDLQVKQILITLLIFFFLSFNLNAVVLTGDDYLDYVNEGTDGYINFLNGYVAGLYDTHEAELYPCVGSDVKMSALRDAVAIFYRENPSKRRYPVTLFFVTIIKDEWC